MKKLVFLTAAKEIKIRVLQITHASIQCYLTHQIYMNVAFQNKSTLYKMSNFHFSQILGSKKKKKKMPTESYTQRNLMSNNWYP